MEATPTATPGGERQGNGGSPPPRPPSKLAAAEASEAPGLASEASGTWGAFRKPAHRRRMTLHHSTSPKCSAPKSVCAHAEGGCAQCPKARPRPRTIALFFQNGENDSSENAAHLQDEEGYEAAGVTMQEVVCPWESSTTQSYIPH